MTTYINVGATFDTGNGDGPVRVKTKAALRKALDEAPGDVMFDVTSMLVAPGAPKHYRGDEVPDGVTLSVVGPDPYEARVWYASVKLRNGEAKVTA